MKQRDPIHDNQLKTLQQLEPSERKHRIEVSDYKSPEYVESEVLASIVRLRLGGETIVNGAAAELHRRITKFVSIRIRTSTAGRQLLHNNNQLIEDALFYIWDNLLGDQAPISNSEVRFAVFVKNKVTDFLRHMMTKKNSMSSVEDLYDKADDSQYQNAVVDQVEDLDSELPEEALMRKQKSAELIELLQDMPKLEQSAFYFRIECEFEWPKVASLLGCSIPTARKHLKNSYDKLQGAMK